ncbi:MAG: exopolysaccharide transport family protein [Caballeronia sp.]|jgi:tyrosine-protein kinase Etk/Wzc|uniref:GNVR domain-containing protein n=1 Tax=Caballeronia sp. TaxID=1931223 RepID=UPI00262CE9CC|nr:GNVR domain-containing protein [Caballeronia sp.]MDB5835162.1 exopolysaccharide transport family protein [Caballeronia sp.]
MNQASENIPMDSTNGNDFHIGDYFAFVLRNWRIIAAITFAVLVVGLAYACFAPPVYRADASIQVEADGPDNREQVGQLQEIFDSRAKTTADTEMELMRSRLVITAAVRKLNLDIQAAPRYFPVVGAWWALHHPVDQPADPVLGLSQYSWGGATISVSRFDVAPALEGKEFFVVAGNNGSFELVDPDGGVLARGKVGENVSAMSARGRVELNVGQLQARAGTEFKLTRASELQTITDLQEALFITERIKQSGLVSVSLDGRDPKRLAQIVNAVANEYVAQNVNRMSAEAEHSLAFLEQQLPVLRDELEASEQRYNAFRNEKGTVDLSEEGRLLLQQIVDNKSKTILLEQRRADAAQRFQPSHEAVATFDAQIALLTRELGVLTKRVAALPDTEQSALRLSRDVRVNTELYTNLLNSAQQLRVIKAGRIGGVRLVDSAVVPERPVAPNRRFVVSATVLLGVVLGIAVARVRAAINQRVERSVEIERVSGIPVYAVVPHSARQLHMQRRLRRGRDGARVLALEAPQDVAVESLRVLRTALQGLALSASNNIVMITGTRPDAGKSFLSVNFAAVSAVAGRRVLLIDADMRCGNLHTYFGRGCETGFANALTGTDARGLVVHDVMPGVDFLPRGVPIAAPDELLLGDRAQAILAQFSREYDVVIVDTPPLLAVTDTALLCKCASTTLLVVRYEQHSAEEIAEAGKRLGHVGAALSGILVTDVPNGAFAYKSGYSKYYKWDDAHAV